VRGSQRPVRRAVAPGRASQVDHDSMTLPAVNAEIPAHQNNVRLVLVDDKQQPAYVKRAAELEKALLAAAAKVGIESVDMPGLRGLCVEAVRSAEVYNR
jgi:hypothetical protein